MVRNQCSSIQNKKVIESCKEDVGIGRHLFVTVSPPPKDVGYSLRRRFLYVSAVLAIVLLLLIGYTNQLVTSTADRSAALIEDQGRIERVVADVRRGLEGLDHAIYGYFETTAEAQQTNSNVEQGNSLRAALLESLSTLERLDIGELDLVIATESAASTPFAADIKAKLVGLKQDATQMIGVLKGNDSIQPTPAIKTQMTVRLHRAWGVLSEFESRLGDMKSATIKESIGTSHTLSFFIWSFSGIVYALITGLILIFEYVIRRPLLQVASALEAEGAGLAYDAKVGVQARETRMLMNAFDGMRAQVRSRQNRLRSIVDNAGEGIITVDAAGCVETFNGAAEHVFGYAANDIIGKPVMLLFPRTVGAEQETHIQSYVETGQNDGYRSAREISGRRLDGTLFPLSIKVTELDLDGQQLFTAIVADISERKTMLDELRRIAEHDALTGLHNRHYFMSALDREVQRVVRGGDLDQALLYIDLDNFKYVNDTLGHLAGDRLLVEVTGLLTSRVRQSDILGRLGGDEFAILLHKVDKEIALTCAEAFRQILSNFTFRYQNEVVNIGCSIGVAMFFGGLDKKEDLLMRADMACHVAKFSGRNRVHFYDPQDDQHATGMVADMGWVRTIKRALDQDQFVFAFQPITIAENGKLFGYELLLRMKDERGNLIPAAGFLPSAERFGLILEIDQWVIKHAFSAIQEWDEDKTDLAFSINLSAKSLDDASILESIAYQLQHNRMNRNDIIIDITESAAMADLRKTSDFIQRLHALNCCVALDDFGTMNASVTYLQDLPVDYVKLSGKLIENVEQNLVARTIVKSIVDVCRSMNKQTIAECTKDHGCGQALQSIGVELLQGYSIGRPRVGTSNTNVIVH